MSEENVEIVRSVCEAFNRRDWDAAFRDTVPDFEFTTQRGPNAGTHRGREAVQRLFQDQDAAFDLWQIEPEEFFEKDELVVVFLRFHLLPRGGSTEFEIRIGTVWTIRDRKVVSAVSFPKRQEALEAAGLGG